MEQSRSQQIAALLLTLLMMWFMIPEHQRRLTVMRVAHGLERAAGRQARREGRLGMGSELDGRLGEADRRYSAAFWLSVARDRFRQAREAP